MSDIFDTFFTSKSNKYTQDLEVKLAEAIELLETIQIGTLEPWVKFRIAEFLERYEISGPS